MSAEKILDNHYKPRMHWKAVNRENVLNAMDEHAQSLLKEKLKIYKAEILKEERERVGKELRKLFDIPEPKI